ncbi:hypothetical protein STEG23_025519 [Scotinomys teguina]
MTDSPVTTWTAESVTDTFSSSTVTVFSAKMESDRGDNTCGNRECHTNLIPLCTLDSPEIMNTGYPGDRPGHLLRHKNSSIGEDKEVYFKIPGLEISVKPHTDMKTPPLQTRHDRGESMFTSQHSRHVYSGSGRKKRQDRQMEMEKGEQE